MNDDGPLTTDDGHTGCLLDELAAVCHALHARGLVAAWDGNVSVRDGGDGFWITRSGIALEQVTRADLVRLFPDGVEGTHVPSSEWRMHAALYAAVPEVNAVVHAHPPHATAFAVCGRALDAPLLPEVVVKLGAIPLVPYATPGTSAVGAALAKEARRGTRAFLLENHGATTAGNDVWEAFYLMEKVEHAARITFLAERLGTPQRLSAEEVARLRTLYG